MAWETEDSPFTYDGLITGAEFGFHEKFVNPDDGEPRALLILTVATSLGDERTELLTTGTGWVPGEDGATITHETRTKFSNQSAVGKFIDRILAIDGVADVLSKGYEEQGLDEFHAASYVGLEFHWESEPVFNQDGTPKMYEKDGEQRQSQRMVPVSLISAERDGAKPAKAAAKKAPAKKAPAKKAAAAKEAVYEPDEAIMAKLVKLAGKASDHEAFTDLAYTALEDEIAADQALEQFVLDEANWTTYIGV